MVAISSVVEGHVYAQRCYLCLFPYEVIISYFVVFART